MTSSLFLGMQNPTRIYEFEYVHTLVRVTLTRSSCILLTLRCKLLCWKWCPIHVERSNYTYKFMHVSSVLTLCTVHRAEYTAKIFLPNLLAMNYAVNYQWQKRTGPRSRISLIRVFFRKSTVLCWDCFYPFFPWLTGDIMNKVWVFSYWLVNQRFPSRETTSSQSAPWRRRVSEMKHAP